MKAFLDRAEAFDNQLSEAKSRYHEILWYPYETLSNLFNVNALLTRRTQDFWNRLSGRRVLDLGAGDGDLTFFLESEGFSVDAIENPQSNHSSMQGIRTMHAHLGSKARLFEMDVDRQFTLPENTGYDLALALGLLYHLKNPFYFLETLSRGASYCLLSTPVADGLIEGWDPRGAPVAYLAGADEINADETNFWFMTEPCLRRLIERAGWSIVDWLRLEGKDSRVYALLASRSGLRACRLLAGWYEDEGSWRWTQSRFGIMVPVGAGKRFALHAYAAPELLTEGSNRLAWTVDGKPAGERRILAEGRLEVEVDLAGAADGCVIEFALDRPIVSAADDRDLGLVVEGFELRG